MYNQPCEVVGLILICMWWIPEEWSRLTSLRKSVLRGKLRLETCERNKSMYPCVMSRWCKIVRNKFNDPELLRLIYVYESKEECEIPRCIIWCLSVINLISEIIHCHDLHVTKVKVSIVCIPEKGDMTSVSLNWNFLLFQINIETTSLWPDVEILNLSRLYLCITSLESPRVSVWSNISAMSWSWHKLIH